MDPDLPLFQALQAGDDSALGELINRHREPLFHFAYRHLRDEIAARDVVQETFVRAYFKAREFRPRATVKTWLYAIALNLCRDQFRRFAKRRRELPLDAPTIDDSLQAKLADAGPTPDVDAERRDRFARLQEAIDQLPETLRDALVVFALEGKSQMEAADILGTTPKGVETRVYHAKNKLRALLNLYFGENSL